MNNTKEYIACAAIHYNNGIKYPFMEVYGIESGFVLCGFRHPYIMSVLPTNVHYEQDEDKKQSLNVQWDKSTNICEVVQGFMTSYGRFVDRKEAKNIAIACGQCKEEEIYSSDLFLKTCLNTKNILLSKTKTF